MEQIEITLAGGMKQVRRVLADLIQQV